MLQLIHIYFGKRFQLNETVSEQKYVRRCTAYSSISQTFHRKQCSKYHSYQTIKQSILFLLKTLGESFYNNVKKDAMEMWFDDFWETDIWQLSKL
jgi:hypothetical protein